MLCMYLLNAKMPCKTTGSCYSNAIMHVMCVGVFLYVCLCVVFCVCVCLYMCLCVCVCFCVCLCVCLCVCVFLCVCVLRQTLPCDDWSQKLIYVHLTSDPPAHGWRCAFPNMYKCTPCTPGVQYSACILLLAVCNMIMQGLTLLI